ncbi:glycosyl hydrolase family 99 protein [Nitzschia inconspicua]|uniref:Glycosyl hydrolase family 99 protein n=1 Tax=Nitzschia inconspicua TaxID=303405 RepID=A0A9K3LGV2_9STRA|nr:glycosyl hydrolase family 99 protein [Nitzschia inconspicua]
MKTYSAIATSDSHNEDRDDLIAEWNVRIEKSGSYQFAVDWNEDDCDEASVSLSSHPLDLWVDHKQIFSFTNSCQMCCTHLSNESMHLIKLIATDNSNILEPRIVCLDVRLSFPDCNGFPQTKLLMSGESISKDHDMGWSPSRRYSIHYQSSTGDLLLRDHQQGKKIVWNAGWNQKATNDSTSNFVLAMQGDGNLLLQQLFTDKRKKPNTVWKTVTQGNPGAYLVVNDAGQVMVIDPNTKHGCCSPLYMDGLPSSLQHYADMRQDCQNDNDHYRLLLPRSRQPSLPSSNTVAGTTTLSPQFPLRGIFYYPWYPTTWTIDKTHTARFIPKLGMYDSGHLATIENHVQQLDYARIDVAISSWWGQDTKADRARLLTIMDVSYRLTGGRVKFCIYFEPQQDDDTVEKLRQKLDYLHKWYTVHPSWLRVDDDDKPVIFVYNLKSNCSTSQKWVQACAGQWHLVLKWFSGWKECHYQPQSWHQYGPSKQWHYGQNEFVNISPGFWQAREESPRLERLDKKTWYDTVRQMVATNKDVKWHLITSFNEAGEGTLIEATNEWDSNSGFGFYLDALHEIY